MTYLNPKKWWMRIFKSIYQCQTKSITQQLEEGVRYFDVRISFDKNGIDELRHGLVAFKGDILVTLGILNNFSYSLKCLSNKNKIIVRIVLEKVNDELDYTLFRNFCKRIEEKYPYVTFTCGEDKKTKEVIYDFKNFEPVTEMYGSVRGKGLERIFPKLYAKRYNKELKEQYKDSKYLMLDFI